MTLYRSIKVKRDINLILDTHGHDMCDEISELYIAGLIPFVTIKINFFKYLILLK